MYIKAIIWDLDGTLYEFNENFDNACIIAAAKAGKAHGFKGTQNEAETLARDCFAQKNNGLEIFVEHGAMMTDLHETYHTHIDITHFAPYSKLAAEMVNSPFLNAILTHGSTNWANRVLKQLNLSQYFKSTNIFGMEKYLFHKKNESLLPFESVLKVIKLPPSECLIVEDNINNLKIPYQMGMNTALLDKELSSLPDFVQYQFNNPVDLLQFFKFKQANV